MFFIILVPLDGSPRAEQAMLLQALAEGTRVESVAGGAAARLVEHGRIGAWTRF